MVDSIGSNNESVQYVSEQVRMLAEGDIGTAVSGIQDMVQVTGSEVHDGDVKAKLCDASQLWKRILEKDECAVISIGLSFENCDRFIAQEYMGMSGF